MSSNSPRGIGGWLLLFCLSMTVRPLISAYTLAVQLPVFMRRTDPKAILLLYDCSSILIICFGLYSAFLLWTVSGRAVTVAKAYLFALLVYWLLLALLPFLLSRYAQTTPLAAFFRVLQKQLPVAIVYCSIWLAYLYRSERVANTYAPAHLHDQHA